MLGQVIADTPRPFSVHIPKVRYSFYRMYSLFRIELGDQAVGRLEHPILQREALEHCPELPTAHIWRGTRRLTRSKPLTAHSCPRSSPWIPTSPRYDPTEVISRGRYAAICPGVTQALNRHPAAACCRLR